MKKYYLYEIDVLRDQNLPVTIERFIKKVGIGHDSYYKIRNGKIRGYSTIEKIADYFNFEIGRDDNGIYWYEPKFKFQASELPAEDAKVTYKQLELLEWLKNELGIKSKEEGQKILALFLDEQGKFDQNFINAVHILCNRRKV